MFSCEALKVAYKNKYKRWTPVVEKEKKDPIVAMNRFKSRKYFNVNHNPRFKIKKDDVIYTVGSCFARNVERVLLDNGIDVIGKDFSINNEIIHSTVGVMKYVPNSRSLLNKYSVHSMHEEFHRVIENKEIRDFGLVEIGNGKWVDPLLSQILKPLPYDDLLEIRKSVDKLVSKVVESDIVFFTFGLVEVWYDEYTGAYLNSSPPPKLMRKDNNRFRFLVPSYSEIFSKIDQTIALIKKYGKEDIKFVLTVSPVPLGTTWTNNDVVAANCYSKSTLRSVSQELVSKYEYVDYFPSYEMVINSPRDLAWQNDELHVQPKMVEFVMNNFVKNWLEENVNENGICSSLN